MAEEHQKIIRTQKDAEKHVQEQYDWHTSHAYKWLTPEIAEAYHQKMRVRAAQTTDVVPLQFELCNELQTIYGVTRLEAVNILNGYHINDYVEKYKRIETKTPIKLRRERGSGDVEN